MSRLRWPDSTNSVSEKPGTIHYDAFLFGAWYNATPTTSVKRRNAIASIRPL